MYITLLFIHSWLRYAVLALGLWLLVIAVRRVRSGTPWSPIHERVHVGFLAALDTQLLLGLLLYFVLSPVTEAALANMSGAMKDGQLRFFGVEHIATMFIAIAVAHIGRVRSKRKAGTARYRSILVFQTIWLLLTLAAIPWPGLDVGRPLFRM
jgi:hypothetical protein